MTVRFVCLAALLFAVGCGSYADDLKTICESPSRSGASAPGMDPMERAVKLASFITKNLRTDQGKALFGSLANLDGATKIALLRGAASKAGIPRCELADVWERH